MTLVTFGILNRYTYVYIAGTCMENLRAKHKNRTEHKSKEPINETKVNTYERVKERERERARDVDERDTTAYLENCKLATTFAGSKHVNYVTVAYIYRYI